MNPIQFFIGRVAPFRLKKKKVRTACPKEQGQQKSEFEERRRMATYRMDQEAKRLFNGHL